VILVCLFAFIFTPMAIQFAARTYNWKALAEYYDTQAKNAMANAQAAKSIANSETQHYQSLREADLKRLLESEQKVAELSRKNEGLTQDGAQLARSRDMLETQSGVLTAQLAIKSKHNDELLDAKEKALARERELQTTNSWLTDQLQLKRAEADVLKQQLNQKLQEIIAFRDENEKLRKSLKLGKASEFLTATPNATVEPVSPAGRAEIQGKVTEVKGRMVSVDAGSASGVKEGTTLVILRKGNYVGDIKVTSATPTEAVGEIGLTGDKGLKVQPGDMFVDKDSFEQR
jgi:hypothetical protein